ncbi:axin-1-like isoform X1 [Hypomesus transpacificus]|uniref:axin-1-like isoform X1 n=1 Tax=Hypomesus transpacificus TaxID=137520 RepID=UPI001F0723D6|nr:axin-1-like isoform X1 [Hypomesus transpacificus]
MSAVRDIPGIGYRGSVLEGHAPFTEDAPRPPVPGEEGGGGGRGEGGGSLTPPSHACPPLPSFYHPPSKADLYRDPPSATPRRPDLDLGYEPEGSASPTPPYLKWAESLHSLLDDQEGIQLFRSFLRQEGCADLLDFWFACSGFRKTANQEKRPKLAKAIYRKYVQDGGGIVARQIKPATKSFIRDCVVRLAPDASMFEQAQTEIQTTMEENTYPLFLKSDVYLEYTRTGGESPKPPSEQSPRPPGYLPTLTEDVEWRNGHAGGEEEEEEEEEESGDTPANRLTHMLLMETAPQRTSTNKRTHETGWVDRSWREPANPYYVNMGYAHAPATSANDSEQQSMSSDADTLSLTDSSLDGIPPYRYHRKHHRREMHDSVKANGRVPLPHIPRTYRMPKDVQVEPERFAADLIRRLQTVLREREAQERLEERLRRVRLEEEGDDADVSMATTLTSHGNKPLPPSSLPPLYGARYSETGGYHDDHEDNPEAILDEHVQRVMRTPGGQSPGATTGRPSPKSRSPDGGVAGSYPRGGAGGRGHRAGQKGGDNAAVGAGVFHHKHNYHHPPGGVARSSEEAGLRGQFVWNGDAHHYAGRGRNYADGTVEGMLGYGSKGSTLSKRPSKKVESGEEGRGLDTQSPLDDLERNQKILQWMMEGEALRHKKNTHGSSSAGGSSRKGDPPSASSSRPVSVERPGAVHPWVSAQLRNPGVVTSHPHPGVMPSHPFIQDPTMPPNPAPNPLTQLEEARRRLEEERRRSALGQQKQRHKSAKRPANENVTVAYYFCGEPIPYRTSVRGRVVTLGQFKELLTKKGGYRFYFKRVSDEFDCGVVFEEVKEDDAILPIYEEKIVGKVEKVD